MSQAPQSHDDGPIQTPKQLIVAIVAAFVLPVLVIALLVNYVNSVAKEGAGSNALAPEAVATRIMPVAAVQVKAITAAAGSRSGEEVFKGQCASCHTAGALGAPKYGDGGAWAPRIGQGLETLWTAAMKGKNAMPPQGGGEYADIEIKRAVAYMANAGGAKFEEPAVAAAAASDAAPAASAP
jgi:cytochrome c5